MHIESIEFRPRHMQALSCPRSQDAVDVFGLAEHAVGTPQQLHSNPLCFHCAATGLGLGENRLLEPRSRTDGS